MSFSGLDPKIPGLRVLEVGYVFVDHALSDIAVPPDQQGRGLLSLNTVKRWFRVVSVSPEWKLAFYTDGKKFEDLAEEAFKIWSLDAGDGLPQWKIFLAHALERGIDSALEL